ncbi:MAG: sigma-70 family RNA polymerase sigma factor [Patescibacteria group bacterium]
MSNSPHVKVSGEDILALYATYTAAAEAEKPALAHQFVGANQRMVAGVVKQLLPRGKMAGLAWKDLMQAGNVGLLEAFARFDSTRGVKFSTYAHHWVKKEVRDEIDRQPGIQGYKIPRVRHGLLGAVRDRTIGLERAGQKPTLNALGDLLEGCRLRNKQLVTRADIASAVDTLATRVVSLQAPTRIDAGNRETIQDAVSSDAPGPDTILASNSTLRKTFVRALKQVRQIEDLATESDERARDILIHRLGLFGAEIESLKVLSLCWDISKERVRQLQDNLLLSLGLTRDEALAALDSLKYFHAIDVDLLATYGLDR